MKWTNVLIGVTVIVFFLFIQSCIDKIDLRPTSGEDRLVIFGSIDNYDHAYEVAISRTGDFDGQLRNPVVNAKVMIVSSTGNEVELIHDGEGIYKRSSFSNYTGVVGESYQLIVEIQDVVYKSTMEEILPTAKIDSINFVTERSQYRTDQGFIGTKEEFKLFGYFSLTNNDTWLRWDIENVYAVPEIYCGPFDPVELCYVEREKGRSTSVPLWDGNLISLNTPTKTLIQTREVDVIYGQPQYFNVYQRRISKDTYDYWIKINTANTDGETIFTIPPASISGNIENEANPSEEVLGIFEAVSVDTARVFTLPQFLKLGRTLNGICGVPGFRPSPLPPECCSCRGLPNSTVVRPEWWD